MAAMDATGEEPEYQCPLCAEEMDLTDRKFQPCKCGYQICLWCWHQIMELSSNTQPGGRCPACRTPYDKEKIISAAPKSLDLNGGFSEKKGKSSKGKFKTAEGRKHLSNVRVVRRNLVYAVGLPVNLADESILERKEYFGQYGKILKISVSRGNSQSSPHPTYGSTASVYVTFVKEEDAYKCIQAIDGCMLEGKIVRGCFGTTKYCNSWIKNVPCTNPDCLYLHESGTQEDSYTKEEMLTKFGRYQMFHQLTHPPVQLSGPGLPPPPLDSYPQPQKSDPVSLQKRIPAQQQLNSISISPAKVSNTSSNVSAWGNSLPLSAAWGSKATSVKDDTISSRVSSTNEPSSMKPSTNAKISLKHNSSSDSLASKTSGFALANLSGSNKSSDTESNSSKMFNQSERSISKPSFETSGHSKSFTETQTSRVKWSALALSLKSSRENGHPDMEDSVEHQLSMHVSGSKSSTTSEDSGHRKSSQTSNSVSDFQKQFTTIDYFNDDDDDEEESVIKRSSDAFESSNGSNLPKPLSKLPISGRSRISSENSINDNPNRNSCLDKEDEEFLRSLISGESSPSTDSTDSTSNGEAKPSKTDIQHSERTDTQSDRNDVLEESIPLSAQVRESESTSIHKSDPLHDADSPDRELVSENQSTTKDTVDEKFSDDIFDFTLRSDPVLPINLPQDFEQDSLPSSHDLNLEEKPLEPGFTVDLFSSTLSSVESKAKFVKNTSINELPFIANHDLSSFSEVFGSKVEIRDPLGPLSTSGDPKHTTIPLNDSSQYASLPSVQDFHLLTDSYSSVNESNASNSSPRSRYVKRQDADPKGSDEDVIRSILDLDLDFVSDIPLSHSTSLADLLHLKVNDKPQSSNQGFRKNSRFQFARDTCLNNALDYEFNSEKLQYSTDNPVNHLYSRGFEKGEATVFPPYSDSPSNSNITSKTASDSAVMDPQYQFGSSDAASVGHVLGTRPVVKSVAKASAPPGFNPPPGFSSGLTTPPGFSAPSVIPPASGLSAPPGFATPPGFSVPPGFSALPKPVATAPSSSTVEENAKVPQPRGIPPAPEPIPDTLPEEKLPEPSKSTEPAKLGGEPSELELEFVDPAIMAVGKGSIPLPNGSVESTSAPVSSFFGSLFRSNDHPHPPVLAPPKPSSRSSTQYPDSSFLHSIPGLDSMDRRENSNASENGYPLIPDHPHYFRAKVEAQGWTKPFLPDPLLSSDARSTFDMHHGFTNPNFQYPSPLQKFSSPSYPVPVPDPMSSGPLNGRLGFSVSASPFPTYHGLTNGSSAFDLSQRLGDRYAPSQPGLPPKSFSSSPSLLHALHASSFHNYDHNVNNTVLRNESLNPSVLLSMDKRSESIS